MEKKGPRIVRLGPQAIDQNEDLWSPVEESDKDFEELVFLPREFYMKPNQESELSITENGDLRVIVKQDYSTPGFKMDTSVVLEKGEYELEVIGSSSVERTFFPWAINKSTSERLTPIVHLTSIKDSICVPFSIEEKNRVVIGVLCHNQMIDDECHISSMTIRKLEEISINSEGNFNFIKPERFLPHQKTSLRIEGEHLLVTSESYSTPGTYAILDVEPGSKISIRARVEMFPGCSAFLYVSPTNGGNELTKRNVIFGRGVSKDHILEERYSFLDIPWDVHSVRIGLLFSTISSADTYKMTIQKIEVVEVRTLEEIVDSTYVLSLENEGEKFDICQREAKRHGILLNRWEAVNGYSDKIRRDWENYMDKPWTEYDRKLGRKAIDKPGAWGYLLTMKEIFSDALDRQFGSIAVFDDDFVLSKTFTHDLSRLMQKIGDKWDVIYLGASQWAWDGIETDTGKGYYIPSQSTNGSFAVIYRSTIFEDLIYEIRKMDAPFDSGPLGFLTTTKFKSSSFVSFPNIAIANVEKEGIRDSRNQIEFSRRFRWKLEDFPAHFTSWNNSPIVMREEWASGFDPKNTQRVLGVTTFNRRDYLVDFITSFERTASMDSNWCLIVADDGSTDGTMEWLISEYEPSGFGLIVIRNDSLGIARQSNSILSVVEQLGDDVEVLYMCNDDIRFERSGWDDLYFDSMKSNGFDHLVYFNPDWKDPIMEEIADGQFPLISYCDSEYVMGCFYTITPDIINKIGYFDEEEFPVRGHSHIDYTIRACRIGANKESTTFDVLGSNDYINMETKEEYIRTHKILGIWEDKQISSPQSLRRREALLKDKTRLFIERRWK